MIKVSAPDIREEDLARVAEVIRSGQLVQAGEVAKFEQALGEFADLPQAVAVSSCTAALHLSLLALGIGPGDQVIVPAFTFPASANVVEVVGARCVFCEVDPNTYVITPALVEDCLARHRGRPIKALMVVHEFGQPAAMRELAALAARENLILIEDAACALGSIADGSHVGHYSRAACFSFHPRKAITTGDGGAVLTRNPELAATLRRLRNHGMERMRDGELRFPLAGLNYRMTEFQAALGGGQLPRFRTELQTRAAYARVYDELLAAVPDLRRPALGEGHSWQSYMVVLPPRISRTGVMQELAQRQIQTTIGAQALNCLEYFQQSYGLKEHSFSVASELYRRGLVLPMYGKLGADQIRGIAAALLEVLAV
ncbi:MAG: DegT/DnrJ/EryC1/StrS family aminotransferase [Nevskiales bacterium]